MNLTGRNEIRVSNHGKLAVAGGTVSSLRWINIAAGASFGGHGKIDGHLQNSSISTPGLAWHVDQSASAQQSGAS